MGKGRSFQFLNKQKRKISQVSEIFLISLSQTNSIIKEKNNKLIL